MNNLVAGQVEVTGSTTEQIGLPGWSQVTIMVSAKAVVVDDDHDVAHSHLSQLTHEFCREQVQRVTQALKMWAGLETEQVQVAVDRPWTVAILGSGGVELTYSMTERISLPSPEKGQNNAVNLLASSKRIGTPGQEIVTLQWLTETVRKQMNTKRDLVMADRRPWTLPV